MKEFEFMEETVNEMCLSLIEEPEKWIDDIHTLDSKESGIRYWKNNNIIFETWNGYSRAEVFSVEQGRRIYAAYSKMREIKASKAQKKVIDSFKKKTSIQCNKWWRFWK